MTEEELRRLLRSESASVEWKKTGEAENIVETLTAFANDYEAVGRGYVFCGVEEREAKPALTGMPAADAKDLRNKIFQYAHDKVTPPIEPQFETVALEGGIEVLIAWIPASSEVHFYKGKVVVRRGDKTVAATAKQHSRLVERKFGLDWLNQPCLASEQGPGATLDDIDPFSLAEVVKGRGLTDQREALDPSFRLFGSVQPLTVRVPDPVGERTVPKRSAMLLIGKEPQLFIEGAFAVVTRFQGTDRAAAVFQRRDIFGSIPFLIREVMARLNAETVMITDKTLDFLSGAQNRWKYSERALREFLVNALAHRDYREPRPVRVYIFDDRIEFESPGGFVNGETIESVKKGMTHWRNPSLARILRELGFAQESGSGLPTAFAETLALAGSEPVIEASNIFKVIVPAYQPPRPTDPSLDASASPAAGALLISIGRGAIDPSLVRRSGAAFRDMPADRIRSYHYDGLVEGEQWLELLQNLRDWLRNCMEDAKFAEFHVFYRGPVAAAILIGAMAAGRKPLLLYSYDEEALLYRFASRIDRRLLQGSSTR